MRDITLCIINRNGEQHLPHAFAALREQSWPFAEVLLVDDASTADVAAVVESLWPEARLLRLETNQGPAAARNAGFAAARNDLILFQDNDVRLEPETAAVLVEDLLMNPGTLAVAPRVLYASRPARVHFDSADCHFLGLLATRNAEASMDGAEAVACDTTSIVTACFLVDRARWAGGAPFDETLGFNLEDHDFGVRACVAGHRLRVQPRARVLHGSGTPGLSYRPGRVPGDERQFYLTRNRWIVIAKCYAPRTLFVLAPALLLFEGLQLGWLIYQGRGRLWLRALASLWRARRHVSAARREVQRTRRIPDGRVLRDAPLPMTRHVRETPAVARIAPIAERLFRAYWLAVRRWIEGGGA